MNNQPQFSSFNTCSFHSENSEHSERSLHSEHFSNTMTDTLSSPSSISSNSFNSSYVPVNYSFQHNGNNNYPQHLNQHSQYSLLNSSFRSEPDLDSRSIPHSNDPVTLAFLIQSAISSAQNYTLLSDAQLLETRIQLSLLESRASDLELKIEMEKKIKMSAERLANCGIGKWSKDFEDDSNKEEIEAEDENEGGETRRRKKRLSKHALDELTLSTHNLQLLTFRLEQTKRSIERLRNVEKEHHAGILAITHPGCGTKVAKEYYKMAMIDNYGQRIMNNGYGDSKDGTILPSSDTNTLTKEKEGLLEIKSEIKELLQSVFEALPELKSEQDSKDGREEGNEMTDLKNVVSKLLTKCKDLGPSKPDKSNISNTTRELNTNKNDNTNSSDNTRTDENPNDDALTQANNQITLLSSKLQSLTIENFHLKQKYLTKCGQAGASVLLLRHQFGTVIDAIGKNSAVGKNSGSGKSDFGDGESAEDGGTGGDRKQDGDHSEEWHHRGLNEYSKIVETVVQR